MMQDALQQFFGLQQELNDDSRCLKEIHCPTENQLVLRKLQSKENNNNTNFIKSMISAKLQHYELLTSDIVITKSNHFLNRVHYCSIVYSLVHEVVISGF